MKLGPAVAIGLIGFGIVVVAMSSYRMYLFLGDGAAPHALTPVVHYPQSQAGGGAASSQVVQEIIELRRANQILQKSVRDLNASLFRVSQIVDAIQQEKPGF